MLTKEQNAAKQKKWAHGARLRGFMMVNTWIHRDYAAELRELIRKFKESKK